MANMFKVILLEYIIYTIVISKKYCPFYGGIMFHNSVFISVTHDLFWGFCYLLLVVLLTDGLTGSLDL